MSGGRLSESEPMIWPLGSSRPASCATEPGERREEDREREDREQEAVRERGGEVRDLVLHDLSDQALGEVELAGQLHGPYPTPGDASLARVASDRRSRPRCSPRVSGQ